MPFVPDTFSSTCTYVATDGDSDSNVATVEVTVNSGPLPIEYELQSRRISLQSNGKITITILGTAALDGSNLDASSIRFVGVSAESWSTEDVDNDGDTDLVLKFDARELREQLLDLYFASESNASERSVTASLTGNTVHDQTIEGFEILDLFLPSQPGKKSGK